jgi:phosphoribosylaminoimidazole-succinocarboxamide synthase
MGIFCRRPVYEGPEKIVYEGPEPGTAVHHFKDFVAANPDLKVTNGHGIINGRISQKLLTHLNEIGLPTYFLRTLNMREQLVRITEPLGLQVNVYNMVDDALTPILGLPVGTRLPRALLELASVRYTDTPKVLSPESISLLEWADENEVESMQAIALRANDFLCGYFAAIGLLLVNFTLHFGRFYHGGEEDQVIICEGLTPDTLQVWDAQTHVNLSATGEQGYYEIAHRLQVLPNGPVKQQEGA